ncbi:tetratricopeptide repeat protein [Streptomyces sp. CB02488]|uniref:tetratricopeptide repeat protein n=1 Tax=Streptomyces sp. CB02488 TaxID=1703920 RepID=UPI0009A0FBF4|nr:tetratricopeptide repeat protein [Streptomyces sp. CB02488]
MVRESGLTGDEGREPVEGAAGRPEGSFFTGRKEVLGRIAAWLEADRAGLFLVTGPAGCGKSAVLDRIATLNGPVRRQETEAHEDDAPVPRLARPLASVLLRDLSPLRAASELARQLGLPEPRNADDFRAGLRESSPQPVLVLDGLDEVLAEHLRAMIEELVLPLGRTAQVLLGSRESALHSRIAEGGYRGETLPDALARLTGAEVTVEDLGREQHTRADIGAYVFNRCVAAGVPEDRARKAGESVAARPTAVEDGFLFARLVAGSLSAGADGGRLPDSVEAAFEEDLRAGPVRVRADGTELPSAARDLLTALAWTAGRGMPAGGVWAEVAGALGGGGDMSYDESDVDWLLSAYGRYVVEDSEGGQTVYRLFHHACVPLLADRAGPGGSGAGEVVLAALVEHVERRAVGDDWAAIDPYVVRGLAPHAVRAGAPGIAMLRGLAERGGAGAAPVLAQDGAEPVLAQVGAAPVLAQALSRFSARLGTEGDLQGALDAAREAAGLYREMEHGVPGAFGTALVRALIDLAHAHAATGDREGALPPAREVVELRRSLAEAGNSASHPDLAPALSRLGRRVSDIGDREGAVALTLEAVSVCRQHVERTPAAIRPGLAAALTDLAASLAAVRQPRTAVAAAQEAVDIYRELAASYPDEFLAPLAAALTQLSAHREDDGDLAGCVAPAREAVELCRELAALRPAAFQPQLAGALQNLADRLSATGDHANALTTVRDGALLYAEVATRHHDVFQPDFARSMSSLANKTAAAGDLSSAIILASEAVRLQRELTLDRPTAALPGLATMLNHLATHLAATGDPAAALPNAEEATALWGRLAAEDPDAFLPRYATALSDLGNRRANLGDVSGALAAARESVGIRRPLAAQQPAVFRQDLATALTRLAAHLHRAEDPAAGLSASEEAVALFRELAGHEPALRSALAGSLGTLAQNLGATGNRKEALKTAGEGVRILRGLVADTGTVHLPDLAHALQNLSKHLEAHHDAEGAVSAAEEAATAYRTLALENPDAFEKDLVSALLNLAQTLARTGDHTSAVRHFDETVAEFASAHPATGHRLGAERSIFLLACPAPHASAGVRELVALLDGESKPDAGANAVTVRARRALRAYGDTQAVRTAWEAETGSPVPVWLDLSPETLNLVSSWMFAPNWPASRDFWSRNAEALSSRETAAALEEAALLDPGTAQRHAALREIVMAHGVTAAYDPLILREQLAEWVDCADWAESRAFLQDHPRILQIQPPEATPLTHVALLDVARIEGLDAAYRLVEDRVALQAYVERALDTGDGTALMHAAAVEGQVFNDKLSSLTHAQASMVLAGAVDAVEPDDLATLLPRAREEIRVRLLREICALSVQHAHPHGDTWLRIVQALSGPA